MPTRIAIQYRHWKKNTITETSKEDETHSDSTRPRSKLCLQEQKLTSTIIQQEQSEIKTVISEIFVSKLFVSVFFILCC